MKVNTEIEIDLFKNFSAIDNAAAEGYQAFSSKKAVPSKYVNDDLLMSAWNVGRNLAANDANKTRSRVVKS